MSTAGQQPVPPPRVALFSQNQVYSWSSGDPFNGFILIQLIPPVGNGLVEYGNLYPSLQLPLWQRVPIINGIANSGCGVFLNADITPPGSVYNAYYYDAAGNQIAGPSTTFTVTTQAAFVPPILTLTVPTTPGTPVTPD